MKIINITTKKSLINLLSLVKIKIYFLLLIACVSFLLCMCSPLPPTFNISQTPCKGSQVQQFVQKFHPKHN